MRQIGKKKRPRKAQPDTSLNPEAVNVTLAKLRSPITVTFAQDPADGHFVNVTERNRNTIVRTHYILLADLQQWIDVFARQGFCAVRDKGKNNDDSE